MREKIHPVPLTLEDEFSALSSECVVAGDLHIKAEETISEKLVKLYLLWRRLRSDQALVVELHQREGLTAPDYSVPEPEFDTLVKIAFRIGLKRTAADKKRIAGSTGGTRRNNQTRYAASLLRLHVEFEQNERRYRTDPFGALLAFHDAEGGITRAAEWRAARNRPVRPKAANGPVVEPAQSSMTFPAAARHAFIKNALPIGARSTIVRSGCRVDPGKLTFDANNCAVVVYERDPSRLRWYEVANDNIDRLALEPAGHIKYVEQPFLRALGEVTRTQLYPKQFAPAGDRVDLGSDFRVWERRVLGAKARRHLLIGPSKIVLSATHPTANLVTEFEPRNEILSGGQVLLRLPERGLHRIEDILDAAALPGCVINPERPRALSSGGAGVLLRSVRAPNQPDTVRPVLLKFEDADVGSKRNLQSSLNLATFTPVWSFSADASWFSTLRRDFIEIWLANPGAPNRITRPENRFFRITVSQLGFEIGYKVDATGSFPTHLQPLGGSDSSRATVTAGNSGTLDVASFDLVRAFGAFPDVQVRKRVTVAGDDRLLLMTFQTDLGAFKIGIPAVSLSTKGLGADPTHMTGI